MGHFTCRVIECRRISMGGAIGLEHFRGKRAASLVTGGNDGGNVDDILKRLTAALLKPRSSNGSSGQSSPSPPWRLPLRSSSASRRRQALSRHLPAGARNAEAADALDGQPRDLRGRERHPHAAPRAQRRRPPYYVRPHRMRAERRYMRVAARVCPRRTPSTPRSDGPSRV